MKVRCGFEWHVQINSGKLFCRCTPKIHEEKKGDSEIVRVFRPSFGESGKIDKSAEFETGTAKRIVYQIFNDSDCLVDIDEEPPHEPDKTSQEVAFQIANALNASLFSKLIFMRKTIVNGSNTSGFQRTAIIGLNGKFKAGKSTIGIASVALEEDSAREETGPNLEAEKTEKTVTYKLDRLGMPLIEIATDVMETDENEAKSIALAFGRFTRLFNVRRGIGTIRQDVNLSIEGGSRVELKGFQNIREMDKAIINEGKRQASLIKIEKEKAYLLNNVDSIRLQDLSEMLVNSGSNMVKNALRDGKAVFGGKLRGFKGALGTELSENKRFGTEISDYLKVKEGCGVIHSDELPAYGIDDKEKTGIATKLECEKDDAFLFSICSIQQGGAVEEVIKKRLRELLTAVPAEVRVVNSDNSTSFLRPLGGKDRMYVETDLPILEVDERLLKEASEYLGFDAETIKEKYGISDEFLDLLIGVNKLSQAVKIREKLKLPFNTIISVMVEDYRYIKRKFGFDINEHDEENVLAKIASGYLAKDAARFIFEGLALKKSQSVEGIINRYSLQRKDRATLEAEIKRLISSGFSRYDTLITNLRDKFGFSFDASEAYEIASKLLKNG
ncbi:Glu-tRNA(Gln) amidotransferase subunit GatE [Candidatus Parvarchaeota archaeon]|nr:Glu-tRNA(Gln) amidotransferase subunit GatE [Candidatus Parvarchaeota archaeon]